MSPLASLLDALKARVSIRVARRILVRSGVPKGTGWEQILEKIQDPAAAKTIDEAALRRALAETLVASDKAVRIFKPKPADMSALRTAIDNLEISPDGDFARHYPFAVPPAQLKTMPTQPQVPVAKINGEQGHGVLFSSVSVIEERQRLGAADVGATTASAFDEVIGIKKIKVQTFDCLYLSKVSDHAYILTDAHIDSSQSTKNTLQAMMRNTICQLVGRDPLGVAVNLLPFIEPIYKSSDGAVKRLAYTTTTSSGKEEWMRGGGNCLREELAHKAGMSVLAGGFKAYGIEIEYPLPTEHGYTPRPLLGIYGRYRMTYEPNPRVEDTMIVGCATIEELETTLSELMQHLSGSKSI